MAHPVLQGSRGPRALCEGQENPLGSGGLWVQELRTPRPGRGLWQTPANGSWSVRKSTSSRSTSQIHGETDRQTGRPRRARPGGRVSGWAGGGRHAAKPLGGRSGERRQGAPAWHGSTGQRQRGTYGRGTGSAAWWWWGCARRPRQGDGAARGRGAEPPPRCTEEWKGSRQQLQGWCGVAGCPVPRSPLRPPLAHRLQ